ncbi:hypothetical protein SAMN05421823_112165 [Catalinimonas alkaloidigena]|uniref:S1 motif domain-containing protein n=1 Tax=Catalinimonas alkaloidigena TaxID=1075417 RepID=A0A1G9SH79_9BACT|nr:S1-like domain-containing RNA-binding protein [Catalinimonas alkaloidigena]SDM34844.1 hypothetical protein SAMN05421823_112165 [Catalinimonas alkaloidigena]
MAELGKINYMPVKKWVDFGVYLEAGEDEILLPIRYVPEGTEPGDTLKVFLYRDSEDRIIATTELPLVQAGECAYLEVVQTTAVGAFLDWGLPKDLLVPFREQDQRMVVGMYYPVYVYIDPESQRLVGSSRLNRFISNDTLTVAEGDAVKLLVVQETDLGLKVVINHQHWGLLYHNEVFQDLGPGDAVRGYIKKIREENKIDVSLRREGFDEMPFAIDQLVRALRKEGGYLPLHDKSRPEDIYDALGMSKKVFKKAVGMLYRERRLLLEKEGIRLMPEE